jgi:hypothetical protein
MIPAVFTNMLVLRIAFCRDLVKISNISASLQEVAWKNHGSDVKT